MRRFLTLAQEVSILEASGEENEAALDYGVLAQLTARAAMLNLAPAAARHRADRQPTSVFAAAGELLELLGALQETGPVLVAIDDAHWIDQPSARVLLFALRRLYADRVLFVLVSRLRGLEPLGRGWAQLLDDADGCERLRLTGLTADDVRQLVESLGLGAVSAAAAERLRQHTGGHPLYVKALLSELPRHALAGDQGPLPAPHSLAAAVLARLTGVSPGARDLVAAAAVAGERCSLMLAGSVAELEDPLAALEEALAEDLLTLSGTQVPREIAFPHPLVRAAVYEDLSPTRRRRLHLAWAELTGGPPSLAHRVAASDGQDERLAAELVAIAEDEVSSDSLMLGVEHLLLASRVAADRHTREDALLRAVEWLGVAGDVPQAHGLREAVLACADSPRRSFTLGILSASAGRLDEALTALGEVTERPDFSDYPELWGPVASSLAIVAAYAGRGSEAIEWAHRARQGPGPTPIVDLTAKQALALGLATCGRGADAVATLAEATPSRIEPLPFEAELLATRGALKSWTGDLPGAVEDLSSVIRWSRAGAGIRSLPNAYGSLALAEYRLGRWPEGLIHAEVAVSLANDSEQIWELAFVNAVASFFAAGRGDWAVAAEHVAAAQGAADRAPLPVSVYYARVAAANLASAREDWESVIRALTPLRDRQNRQVRLSGGHLGWQILEIEALVHTGRGAQAAGALAQLETDIRGGSGNAFAVDIFRLTGLLEQARDRRPAAREAFLRGSEPDVTAVSPLARASLELAFGGFLRRTGSRRPAIARLQAARELFERLQARPFIERCDAELAACGLPGRRSSPEGFGLTAREQVVAQLVASGKTNREVASELYLSTKAIEYHLSNVFLKLDIRSRYQLASRLNRV
jgi:DNA-binding CsgD family transcriptional regulator